MTRALVAVVALAALACGKAHGDALDSVSTGDAGPFADAEAGALPDVGDASEAEPEVDASAEAGDASEAETDADAAPRCPPVAPADLEATFTEKRLAAGDTHACGIRDDGTVACWGGGLAGPYDGYTVPPPGKFVRLAAGGSHTCGIRIDGEVECWGAGKTHKPAGCWPDCGQSMPPPGQFIEIAAGHDSTCGLRPDFTIECWGGSAPIEPPCGQFVQMSRYWELCAVDAEAHVECVPALPEITPGGSPFFIPDAAPFAPRDKVKQVSLDDGCACYLYASGEVDCLLEWFPNWPLWAPPDVELWSREGVAAVSCGSWYACAILEDGTIDCDYAEPGKPVVDGTFSEITCGMSFCCGLHTDGTAACWGNGDGANMPPGFPAGP
jgi:hypothetical protein